MSSRQTRPDPEGPARRPPAGVVGSSSVRRAVTLGPVVSGPGAELTPAVPPSTGTVRGADQEAARPPAAASARASAPSDDGPPSEHSRKPLLAAAGIVGVALLAVPLVVWAVVDSGQKKDNVSTAAGAENRLAGAPLVTSAPVTPAEKPKATPAKGHTPKKHTTKPSPASKSEPKPGPRVVSQVDAKVDVKADPQVDPKVVAEKPAAAPHPATKPSPSATKKPAPYVGPGPQMPTDRSAAAKVLRQAARDPGRHICYRVYVKTFGWQSAVCDGTTAGSGVDSRSVKAIQIAVSGTSGTSATAYLQAKGWVKKPWMTVADGSNLTLGEARQGAPNLSGFGISVGKGNICQNTYSRRGPWQGHACDTPQTANNYIFGGTMDVTRWLDAVRFTV